jgi:hypothetical protein
MDSPAPQRLPRLFIRGTPLPSLRKLSLVGSTAQLPPYTTARARMVARNPPQALTLSSGQKSLLHQMSLQQAHSRSQSDLLHLKYSSP